MVTKSLSSLFLFKFIPSNLKHFINDKIISLSPLLKALILSKSLFNDANALGVLRSSYSESKNSLSKSLLKSFKKKSEGILLNKFSNFFKFFWLL